MSLEVGAKVEAILQRERAGIVGSPSNRESVDQLRMDSLDR